MLRVAYLVWVEDEIQFADIFEALVEDLHEDLDQVKHCQFTLSFINDEDECQRGIDSIPWLITLLNRRGCYRVSIPGYGIREVHDEQE